MKIGLKDTKQKYNVCTVRYKVGFRKWNNIKRNKRIGNLW